MMSGLRRDSGEGRWASSAAGESSNKSSSEGCERSFDGSAVSSIFGTMSSRRSVP